MENVAYRDQALHVAVLKCRIRDTELADGPDADIFANDTCYVFCAWPMDSQGGRPLYRFIVDRVGKQITP